MKRLLLLFAIMSIRGLILAQTTWSEATHLLMGDSDIRSTIAIAVDDINGDLHDDLILLDRGRMLTTFTQTSPDKLFSGRVHTPTAFGSDWSMVSGDLDNDGQPEVISNGNENGSAVLFLDEGTYTIRQNTSAIFSQSSNLVDLNGDSFLDLFVCNDHGENRTYLNNGEGRLVFDRIIDFQTSEADDMSGNYGSIFTDIDSDGDLDLYIAKCRAGVTDPTDPRRVNTLYINDGSGQYQERAADFGLAIGAQSWSVDAGDVDNDGDIDLLITNHDQPHDLMINEGGYFRRYDGLPDGTASYAYQSFFADFDNNGWLDVFITEPTNSYILYNRAMSFAKHDLRVEGKRAFSGATGDFNSDGFMDLYLSFASTFQDAGVRRDAVMLNDGNTNNFVGVHLVGQESNRDAIGAKVLVHEGQHVQLRELTAGKSYGIMNSTAQVFGLGDLTSVDSLTVLWPSGLSSTIVDPEINTWHTIEELGCHTERMSLPDVQLCGGGPEVLSLDGDYDAYLWSDGSTSASITVDVPGAFSVRAIKDGCTYYSNVFNVTDEVPYEADHMISADKTVICQGEMVRLSAPPGMSYVWSSGDTLSSIEIHEGGLYSVTVTTNCDTYMSTPITIYENEVSEPVIVEDTTVYGGEAVLRLEADDVRWYTRIHDLTPFHTGQTLTFGPVVRDTTFFAGAYRSGSYGEVSMMPIVPLNGALDAQYTESDSLPFAVQNEILFKSFAVRTQKEGVRIFQLWQEGRQVHEVTADLSAGVNRIDMNLTLSNGEYVLTTDEENNIEVLGTPGPQLSYSQQYFGNDKKIDHYVRIGESRLYGNGLTPYFFDWQIEWGGYSCEDRYPVTAHLDVGVGTYESSAHVLRTYPNPTSGWVRLDGGHELAGAQYSIYGSDGRAVTQNLLVPEDQMIDLSRLPTGLYVILLQDSSSTWHTIKQYVDRP